jgi:hypothetical protein
MLYHFWASNANTVLPKAGLKLYEMIVWQDEMIKQTNRTAKHLINKTG